MLDSINSLGGHTIDSIYANYFSMHAGGTWAGKIRVILLFRYWFPTIQLHHWRILVSHSHQMGPILVSVHLLPLHSYSRLCAVWYCYARMGALASDASGRVLSGC